MKASTGLPQDDVKARQVDAKVNALQVAHEANRMSVKRSPVDRLAVQETVVAEKERAPKL